MASRYQIPEVYREPRPRAKPVVPARTDVAGFVGFEPRVRDGTHPCELLGTPPVGHAFRIDVASFELVVGGLRLRVPAARDLELSRDPAAIPMAEGESLAYAVVAARDGRRLDLVVVPGAVAAPGRPAPVPADAAVDAAILLRYLVRKPWRRIADVAVTRRAGAALPLVRPALPPAVCDDWNDYLLELGNPVADGTVLAHAAFGYFTNGGSRLYVATCPRPRFDDPDGLAAARGAMVGAAGASEADATGLERLLLADEVSVVVFPDLHTRRVAVPEPLPLAPPEDDACFQPCGDLDPVRAVSAVGSEPEEPVYDDDDVFTTQRLSVIRCVPERWRVQLLLDVPLDLDPVTGIWAPPTAPRAEAWRQQFVGLAKEEELSVAAIYHPWVLAQERADGPIFELPPAPFAAGIVARRDLSRGAHLAPANETLRGVVGVRPPVDDAAHGGLYEPPMNVNVLRAFPGYGVQVWGARTLSGDRWLRYLPVRRCLTAIERRMAAALRDVVFEPHNQLLWLQTAAIAMDVILPLFERGALRGDRPDQAFYVRCDASVNPAESVAAGRLVCEVGVAIAAPAEFLVFRVGRAEGALEVVE
jgi:hypothetical protein